MGSNRNWTKDEIEYLEDKWGTVSIKGISSILGKSINAIKLKAQRLGFESNMESSEYITVNQFSKAIGVSYNTIRDVWIKNDFPVIYKIFAKSQKVKVVDIQKFWKWAEQNKKVLNFAKFEENSLGKEPQWVIDKRKADKNNPSKISHNRPWTKEEDVLLLSLLKAYKYNYAELAERIGRTEGAIRRRLMVLNIKYRPNRCKNKLWTDEEAERAMELYENGYGYDYIGKIIGRTGQQVRGKIERLKCEKVV